LVIFVFVPENFQFVSGVLGFQNEVFLEGEALQEDPAV
jgi:hypothetical protein